MTPEDSEKQRQLDHDMLIRIDGKVDNLTTSVQQGNVAQTAQLTALAAQLTATTTELASVKLDVDRLKTGLILTRWFFGILTAIIGIVLAVYEAFKK